MIDLGDILDVDLTTRSLERRPAPPELAQRVLLGRGQNSLALLGSLRKGVGALDPESPLLFSCGLLTGTVAPTAARVQVSARSPLTGLLGTSSVGGKVGPALRHNGIQSIRLAGKAAEPAYLFIAGGQAELRDASHLWGLDVEECASRLMAGHGDDRLVMFLVGPAGEHELPLACIMTQRGHAAGRTGMGAVMGAKRLKAIVVAPERRPSGADAAARAVARRYVDKIRASGRYDEWTEHGTSTGVSWANDLGLLGGHNYEHSVSEDAGRVDGLEMAPYVEHYRSCQACPVHCKAEVRLPSGPHEGTSGDRPDFEPIVSWGVKAGIADPEAVIYLHHLCDIFGLDSVSAGNAVAFAFDLFERGIIDAGDTGGPELRWGDAGAAETLVRQMAANEGFGAVLGHGVRAAAEQIGRGAERYAYHVKGLELSAYDPRAAMGAGLAYAVSLRGGDYTSAYVRHEASMTAEEAEAFYGDARAADRTSTAGKAQMVKLGMTVGAVLDALGMCKIPSLSLVDDYDLENEAELVTDVARMPTSAAQLMLIGERILTIEQLLNRRLGAGREDDDLPAMFHDEPLPDGPSAGATIDPAAMVAEFYGLMGWTEAGEPSAARLRQLGLGEHAADVRA